MSASINICFSTQKSWLSRLIRFVTRSDMSHALVTYKDETLGKVMVMEAQWRGFVIVPWTRWRQKNRLVARFSLRVPEVDQAEALRKLAGRLGEEYDTLGLFGFALRRWRKRSRNVFASSKKLYCSEACAELVRDSGIAIGDPESFEPQDLFEFLSSSPSVARV